MAHRAIASINLAAIERNTALIDRASGSAAVCAVVKADGYGHGIAASARAAIAGGARWLAVATAGEAAALRAEGLDVPVLVMGALTADETAVALKAGADVVGWTDAFVDLVESLGGGRVHVKYDTGMGRLGTRDPDKATEIAGRLAESEGSTLAGLMTHFATADERDDRFFETQLDRFREWAGPLSGRFPDALVHAANSAAVLREPEAAFDMVRPGVALYGLDPFGEDAGSHGLEPAMEISSWVAAVKECPTGESVGYGRTFVAGEPTVIATVPLGYGDGWRRALGNRSRAIAGGSVHPVVGTISMDNLTVDLGPKGGLDPGAEVVLLGRRDGHSITAEELAAELGTINYEITCSIGPRVTRAYHRDGTVEAGGAG